MNESFRVYVKCTGLSGSDKESVRRLLEERGPGIDATREFGREVIYTSEELPDTPEYHDAIEGLEADVRDAVDADEIKRDKMNTSPQAPGIEGVSYVTGIIIGVEDE